MYKYNTIASENDLAKLECFLNKEGLPDKEWVWLEFLQLKSKEYPEQTLSWDNPGWIFGKFYKFLNRWKNRDLKKKDKETFSDIYSILTDDTVEELLEMLEEAKRLNWH